MKNNVYDVCLEAWRKSPGNQKMWPQLAERFNYSSAESIRSDFKRERIRRGVKNKSAILSDDVSEKRKTIAVVDVETLFMEIRLRGWELYNINVPHTSIEKDSRMLSWSGKYLWSDTVYGDIMSKKDAPERNNISVVESLHKFLSTCDIVIGHNYRGFDWKVINTEFLMHNLPPLRYTIIDTLEIVKSNFKFSVNKLAYLNKVLGIREKIPNEGFGLWEKCSQGDGDSLALMLDYNMGDVVATEELFWRIQPYIHNMPSLVHATDGKVTCSCGCSQVTKIGIWYLGNTEQYNKYRCNRCGGILRGRINLMPREQRMSLGVNI